MVRRAFTTVELLIVLAIIALVAAIAFPVFIVVRRRADHTVCAENLHQLGLGLTLYANDHDGWVPPATTATRMYEGMGVVSEVEIDASPATLRAAMAPYIKNDSVWFCPADRWKGTDTVYLGQSHRLTSYRFFPLTDGERKAWPPKMQLGRDPLSNKPPSAEDIPLLSDVVGRPDQDSDHQFADDNSDRSNHPDDLVNAIRHDLSLTRLPASYWDGTK